MGIFNLHPIMWQSGHFTVYTHGFLFAMGAIFALIVLYGLARLRNYPLDFVIDVIFWMFISGLAASRIGYFLMYRNQFNSFSEILNIWDGGLVSFFGIAVGLTVLYFYLKKKDPKNLAGWLDISLIASAYGWSVGRLGNYWAGDVKGVESQVWQVTNGRVPVALFESILALSIAIFCFWMIRNKKRKDGSVWIIALFLYGMGRFIIDFWRDGSAAGQLISLLMAVAAIFAYNYVKNSQTKRI